LANRRVSFMAVFVITCFIAARVHTPDGETSRATRRKVRGATPGAKTKNVKVPSHANSLKFNDFSCNRGYPDEVGAAGSMGRGAWRQSGERNRGGSRLANGGLELAVRGCRSDPCDCPGDANGMLRQFFHRSYHAPLCWAASGAVTRMSHHAACVGTLS
jgi:hypothetical protein